MRGPLLTQLAKGSQNSDHDMMRIIAVMFLREHDGGFEYEEIGII